MILWLCDFVIFLNIIICNRGKTKIAIILKPFCYKQLEFILPWTNLNTWILVSYNDFEEKNLIKIW